MIHNQTWKISRMSWSHYIHFKWTDFGFNRMAQKSHWKRNVSLPYHHTPPQSQILICEVLSLYMRICLYRIEQQNQNNSKRCLCQCNKQLCQLWLKNGTKLWRDHWGQCLVTSKHKSQDQVLLSIFSLHYAKATLFRAE